MARRGENIYNRKDGRYEGRYIKAYSIDGKAKNGYVYGKTYSEVKEKLNECKVKCKNNNSVTSSNITVSQWFETWLAAQGQLKDTTKMIYSSYAKNHINPAIGDIKLKALNRDILQGFVDKKAVELSPKTTKLIFSALKLALKAANEKNLLADIYSNIKLPKTKGNQVKVLSPQEQKRLEQTVCTSNKPNDIGVLICLYTGIRIGELCGLKWENVNLNKGIITISQTIHRVSCKGEKGKTKVDFSTPKSLSSAREIPIPKFLVKKLSALKKLDGFVINRNGKYIEPRTYSRRFKKQLALSGIDDITFPALRHTISPRALELGVDIKTLSEILGHASATTTLNLYAHSLTEHKKKEMERLGKIFDSPSK